ncbi:hypothetical protein T4A_1379 [Trichinella pseudospiralis]|uniref:Uncharacterized protein n=1 Tax=Trichinella pseudospiralis TaxID=6337 RepID=A0A0V1DJM5_TRIPS|nr:hypothetical protein T4A_1379 [Trichinella pseudospiralis]
MAKNLFSKFGLFFMECQRKLPSSWGINGCESWHCLC